MAIVTILTVVIVFVVGTVLAIKTVIYLSKIKSGIKRKQLISRWQEALVLDVEGY